MPGQARVVIVRPQPGAAATAQLARDLGFDPLISPLFAVEPVAWQLTDPLAYDALLVGSANVFRHSGPQLAALKDLPVYAVGSKTARIARDLGFRVTAVGSGGLAALLPELDSDGCTRVLRLAGEDHVDLPDHRLNIDTRIVYRAVALPMPDALRDALQQPAVVLLHSARAAAHFNELCEAAAIDRGAISLALFAPALREAAGEGWCTVKIAEASDDRALLTTAALLCQSDRAVQHAHGRTGRI